jgi:hypothetical protein
MVDLRSEASSRLRYNCAEALEASLHRRGTAVLGEGARTRREATRSGQCPPSTPFPANGSQTF